MIKHPSRVYKEVFKLSELKDSNGADLKDLFNDITIESTNKFASKISADTQRDYFVRRLATLDASRRIVRETFDYGSVRDGAEFGCGAYGCFYNYLLPKNGSNWMQFDINPEMVEHNRKHSKKLFRKGPKIEIGDLYRMPLEDSSMDVIAGLSSWDCLLSPEKASEEVNRCLRPGGYFVHYQDLHPAETALVMMEARKRIEKRMDPDVPCEFTTVNISDAPFITNPKKFMVSIDSADYGLVRVGRYLTRYMEDLFSGAGFEIILSEEVQKDALVKRWKFSWNAMRNGYSMHNVKENYFETDYIKSNVVYDPSVPKGYIKQCAVMDVLVCQKP